MTPDSPLSRRVDQALGLVRSLCLLVASLCLVVLVVSFGWLVFGRYVLNATPTWVEQLALLLICYIAFLGAAAGVHEDTHIGVALFRDMMPEKLRKIVMIFTDLALAAFGAAMLAAGITLMRFGWDTMLPMLNLPESVRTAAITSLGALMFLFAGIRALQRILHFRSWTPADHFEDV
ncbi:TRAP transporter small permease [Sulfitobacter sp. D35]|uniref:TRAP transporter small permease n=1 Tax=Sulfitobacter sp. D35 TaxID=3083252 RepID=UPI00296E68C2|nr:TRAP transporter small permease [Sulfitobacter sp. D35]MDW4497808.1 TRAP transporter small permease [Sulfitobacter sp. D35]